MLRKAPQQRKLKLTFVKGIVIVQVVLTGWLIKEWYKFTYQIPAANKTPKLTDTPDLTEKK